MDEENKMPAKMMLMLFKDTYIHKNNYIKYNNIYANIVLQCKDTLWMNVAHIPVP